MRRRACVVVALACVLAIACRKRSASTLTIEAGSYRESESDVEAKRTLKVLTRVYPLVCDAGAALRDWARCREGARGYTNVHGCAERARRAAENALQGLRPSVESNGECADELEKASVALLNTAPSFLGEMVKWLSLHSEALIPVLTAKPLGEVCRDTPALCGGEPHDYDDAFAAMRVTRIDTLECTSKIFRCGQSELPDCWPGSIAPRIGVACAGTPNRTGTGPDDLLFVRATGTPLAR